MKNVIPVNTASGDGQTNMAVPTRHFAFEPDRLFDRVFGDLWGDRQGAYRAQASFPLEIVERDDLIKISAEVPGIDPKEIEINLTGQVLTMSAEKRDEYSEESNDRTYTERRFGTFRRSVKLPCPVETDSVKAEHKNGIVTVTLQKSDAVRPRRIEVEVV